ncbi:MAG: AAA family ATPase, partial [Desulfovibrio sp.]|nr:AAA family ATPase [Desulfovibrio sp.]
AHPDVFNTLLQLLDDGRLTDNQGRTVDFRNCIVIMTSNIGSQSLLEGITADGTLKEGAKEKVMESLRAHFRPEFLNRVDETVLFLPLKRDQVGRIVELQLKRLRNRLEEHQIKVELTAAALNFVADEAYDPVYGARPLRRYLQHQIETPLARSIVSGQIHDGETVLVDVADDGLIFKTE